MITFHVGDVFERMADIPDSSVDLIVTSPPFLALRSYLPADHPDKAKEIGSEPTPAAYLSTLLALTREWRRILAPHGSIAVELGDTYSGSSPSDDNRANSVLSAQSGHSPSQPSPASGYVAPQVRHFGIDEAYGGGNHRVGTERFPGGFTGRRGHGAGGRSGWPLPKSLCGIPTLYAWSLAYGRNLLDPDDRIEPLRVRNLIVWHRPNPPVGALGDKCRPSTSYITTACVSDRRWFDLDAERSGNAPNLTPRAGPKEIANPDRGTNTNGTGDNPAGAPPLDCWIDGDVWTIPTAPYKGAHYATYPPALPRRLIRLMCPMHVCTTCGEPRRRITETVNAVGKRPPVSPRSGRYGMDTDAMGVRYDLNGAPDRADVRTLGWSDCGHNTWRRGHTLDPFAGTGTTGQAAIDTGRNATLIDLDERNHQLVRERIGLFLEDTA